MQVSVSSPLHVYVLGGFWCYDVYFYLNNDASALTFLEVLWQKRLATQGLFLASGEKHARGHGDRFSQTIQNLTRFRHVPPVLNLIRTQQGKFTYEVNYINH